MSDDELDALIDASDKSQENLTSHEAWLTPGAGGYKIQLQEDVHGRTLIAGFVDDRVREQSGLQVDDVILSICGESVEGLAFVRTTEMIRHHAREFETIVLKVSRKGAPVAPPKPAEPAAPPKESSSAFVFFGRATRDEIKAAHPDWSLGDVGRELSKRWKALDDAAKKPFHDLAAADKSRYEAEKRAYEATRPPAPAPAPSPSPPSPAPAPRRKPPAPPPKRGRKKSGSDDDSDFAPDSDDEEDEYDDDEDSSSSYDEAPRRRKPPPPRAAPPADSIRGLLAAANEATGTKPFALGATDTPFYRRDGGKGRWLKREDEQLRAILAKVKDMGSADWEKIARKHATRDAGEGYQAWGSAWGQVTSLIKGRSSNMAKNRWYSKFMNAKDATEFFSKEASARAAEAVRKAPKVGVTPGTLAPRAPGKPRPKHRDPTRPIGYYHADTMCYRDDPESRAKAEAWSKEQNAATEFAGGSHMNLNADGQRQPGTYHRAFKNLPTVAGQRIKNPLPRRGAAPGRRKRAGSDDGDEAPRKKSKRKYNPDPPLPLGLWGSDEPIQVEEHHAKRGQSGDRYERYKAARTVIEYEQLGGSARDLRFDISRGLVRCLGEFARPAPATTPAPPPRQRPAPAPPTAPPQSGAQVIAPAPPRAIIPRPVSSCGVCQEMFQDDVDELPCCKARVCNACAREVVAIVTCPFCGGDPSPPPPPPEEDCSNDAAIALALSRRWA